MFCLARFDSSNDVDDHFPAGAHLFKINVFIYKQNMFFFLLLGLITASNEEMTRSCETFISFHLCITYYTGNQINSDDLLPKEIFSTQSGVHLNFDCFNECESGCENKLN